MLIFSEQKKFAGIIEGLLLAIAPLPMLSICYMQKADFPNFQIRLYCAIGAVILFLLSKYFMFHHSSSGKTCLLLAMGCGLIAMLPLLFSNPALTLLTLMLLTLLWGMTYSLRNMPQLRKNDRQIYRLQHELGAEAVLFILTLCFALRGVQMKFSETLVLSGVILITQSIFFFNGIFLIRQHAPGWRRIVWSCLGLIFGYLGYHYDALLNIATFLAILPVIYNCGKSALYPSSENSSLNGWLNTLVSNPAQMIPMSFLLLSLGGTLLLCLPFSNTGSIHPLDAFFTATSAVCVTGLSSLTIATAFTPIGKAIIICLIQIGALGIMTISPIILHFFGHRISMSQERALNDLMEADDREDLFSILALILKFTLTVEFIGAIILSLWFFFHDGQNLLLSLSDGAFTAISAFCSAGFSLHANSMIGFANCPFVLFVTSCLILLGGLSPMAALFIPQWIIGRKIPPLAKIVLTTTAWLVGIGFCLFLCFEWSGLLANLNFTDKLANAWFQTAAARTTGLNSLNISNLSPLSYILYLIMMFIGGSPGSTGGGVKTTIIACLFLCLRGNLRHDNSPLIRNRSISSNTMNKAIALLTAYSAVQCIVIFLLTATQDIPFKAIIFEAISALSTVGLSMDATPQLNAIGKLIVIVTMFIGRIGAATFILYTGTTNNSTSSKISYPNAHLPLT